MWFAIATAQRDQDQVEFTEQLKCQEAQLAMILDLRQQLDAEKQRGAELAKALKIYHDLLGGVRMAKTDQPAVDIFADAYKQGREALAAHEAKEAHDTGD